MNCYAKYLVNRLKVFGAKNIVVTHMLVDKDGHKTWMENSKPMHRKCSMLGCTIAYHTFYVSSTEHMYGNAICFDNTWNNPTVRTIFDINDPTLYDEPLFEMFFLQIMAITERQHVYLHGEKLFEKHSAYEHLLQAELTI